MKIGIIASNFRYPPREGVEVQLIELIKELRRSGHEVEVVGLRTPSADARSEPLFDLGGGFVCQSNCSYRVQAVGAVAHIITRGVSVFFSPNARILVRRVRAWVTEKDAIYIQGIVLAWLPVIVRSAKIVWGPVDAYSLRAHRLSRYVRLHGGKISFRRALEKCVSLFLEAHGIYAAKTTYLCGYADARFLSLVHKTNRICAIPLLGLAERGFKSSSSLIEPNKMVVLWADYRVDYLRIAAERCLVELVIACGNLGLEIAVVGKSARGLSDLCKGAPVRISFHEWTEDIGSFLGAATAVVLPDEIGTGIKNRTIHAMGLGCIVIGKAAAFQSIPVVNGKSCIFIKNWTELETKLAALDKRDMRAVSMRADAVKVIEDYCSRPKILSEWKTLLGGDRE